jgi:hypothetical protein
VTNWVCVPLAQQVFQGFDLAFIAQSGDEVHAISDEHGGSGKPSAV